MTFFYADVQGLRPLSFRKRDVWFRICYSLPVDAVTATTSKRGRPRSEQARRALLEATAELLQERDLPAISADDIAKRAGVSKATIYRWWESKSALALDAFLQE